MNRIKSGHAYVNLQTWFALLQAMHLSGVATSILLMHFFLVQKHFRLAHKAVFCMNPKSTGIKHSQQEQCVISNLQ